MAEANQPQAENREPVTVLERGKVIYAWPFMMAGFIASILFFTPVPIDEKVLTWAIALTAAIVAFIVFLDVGRNLGVALLVIIPLAILVAMLTIEREAFERLLAWIKWVPAPYPAYFVAGAVIMLVIMWFWDLIDSVWNHKWVIEDGRIRHIQPGGNDEIFMYEHSHVGFRKPDLLELLLCGARTLVIRDNQGRVLKEIKNLSLSSRDKKQIIKLLPQDSL